MVILRSLGISVDENVTRNREGEKRKREKGKREEESKKECKEGNM